MKIFFLFSVLFFSFNLFSQEKTRFLEDKSSVYGSFHAGNPIGKYQKILRKAEALRPYFGGVFGYLRNPYGNRKPSPVFYGIEVGFQGGGNEVPESQINGDFRVKYPQIWLNGVVRYRPIMGNTKLNPFIDAFFGGKLIGTSIIEMLSDEQSETLENYNKIVPNYGFGVGTGIKLGGDLKNKYLDIGLYYQQADPTKIIERNSVKIDQKFNISYKTVLTNTNQFIIRVGLTGFFSK